MNAIFDTLAYARRMESVGFSRAQAEAMAEEQARLIDERLATKADIEALRLASKADIATVRADIEALRLATQADIDGLRQATKADIELLRLSTKADIEGLRQSTKADIEGLRLSTKSEVELLRRDVVIKLGGIVIASVAAGSTIVTLLSRLPAHP